MDAWCDWLQTESAKCKINTPGFNEINGEKNYICSHSLNLTNQNVMINRELINPQSIVVVGGSNNVHNRAVVSCETCWMEI